MTRLEFTDNITTLILMMIAQGERVIIDYCKRSDEEQKRLFDAGLSKCDGKIKRSKHQSGVAVDLYFLSEDGKTLVSPINGYEYWHRKWEEDFDGKPEIEWDKNHFEG